MSDYIKEKVLRVPAALCDITSDEMWEFESKYPDLFNTRNSKNYFQVAPTVESFIDYVLYCEYGAECNEYGKTRALSDREKAKYLPIFQQIIPHINMDYVRLVEYCWYNCSEADDYYSEINDPFYDEV